MKAGPRLFLTAALGSASAPAHAHGIPVWMFVAAASPLFVLILVALYGWLASNHNEVTVLGISTDNVIWTAFFLYILHALMLIGLVIIHMFRRLKSRTQAAQVVIDD